MEQDHEALEISGYSRNRGGPKKYEQDDILEVPHGESETPRNRPGPQKFTRATFNAWWGPLRFETLSRNKHGSESLAFSRSQKYEWEDELGKMNH